MADRKRNPRNNRSTLFKRLTRIFSGPLTNRRTQTYHQLRKKHLDKFGSKFKSTSGQSFRKSTHNPFTILQTERIVNQNRMERYREFMQMEYCLHGDTKIAVPGGYKTLKELADEFGLEEEFVVYSYDHSKGEIVPAIGRQARKTRTDHAWKVTFENGQEIIGTSDHRLMLRDGTYRVIGDLEAGDAMMPFYRKDGWVNTMSAGEGWVPEFHLTEQLIQSWGKRKEKPTDIPFSVMIEAGDDCSYDVKGICSMLDTDVETLDEVARTKGHEDFSSVVRCYGSPSKKKENGDFKVSSVEHYGVIDLYDLTVDKYKNFATDSVVSHNTPEISCLHGDSKVATLEGFVTIKELTETKANEYFEVWSWDDERCQYSIGMAHHPRKTGQKKIAEVTLDNGEVIKCSYDHRIMLIDGTYKQAQYLEEGEALMPFNFSYNKQGYMKVCSLGKKFKQVHRYIYEDVFGEDIGSNPIHHIDHNKLNNTTDNLVEMTAQEHLALHGISPITKARKSFSHKEHFNR